MTHLSQRPRVLLTTLQALTVLVGIFGTCLAVALGTLGVFAVREVVFGPEAAANTAFTVKVFAFGGLVTVIGVSVCCYVTLLSFLLLLQRMKKETAFTRRNCQALGRMAVSCAVAAAILFVMMLYISFGVFVPSSSFTDTFWLFVDTVWMLMAWPFGFGVVSLLLQGVRLLMQRAMAMQEEQALVV